MACVTACGMAAGAYAVDPGAADNGACPPQPPPPRTRRMLCVEVDGQLHEWFDPEELGDVARSPELANVLRDNVAKYFGILPAWQAIYDEDGLLTTSADFARALQRISPKLYVYDARSMSADMREQTLRGLEALGEKVERSFECFGVSSSRASLGRRPPAQAVFESAGVSASTAPLAEKEAVRVLRAAEAGRGGTPTLEGGRQAPAEVAAANMTTISSYASTALTYDANRGLPGAVARDISDAAMSAAPSALRRTSDSSVAGTAVVAAPKGAGGCCPAPMPAACGAGGFCAAPMPAGRGGGAPLPGACGGSDLDTTRREYVARAALRSSSTTGIALAVAPGVRACVGRGAAVFSPPGRGARATSVGAVRVAAQPQCGCRQAPHGVLTPREERRCVSAVLVAAPPLQARPPGAVGLTRPPGISVGCLGVGGLPSARATPPGPLQPPPPLLPYRPATPHGSFVCGSGGARSVPLPPPPHISVVAQPMGRAAPLAGMATVGRAPPGRVQGEAAVVRRTSVPGGPPQQRPPPQQLVLGAAVTPRASAPPLMQAWQPLPGSRPQRASASDSVASLPT